MAEEQVLETEQPQPTAEALKQRKKREKAAAKDAALGVEKFTVEFAGVFKPDLKRVMAAHGINNQQEVYQLLLMNLIAADFDTQAKMLHCVTTPFVIDEKVSQALRNESFRLLHDAPGEPEDEIVDPPFTTP
jgi:chemotaxis methyl-accepting protein methylase